MKVAAIYARSAVFDGDAIAKQIQACRDKAQELGAEIPDEFVFIDNGVSGIGPNENRLALQLLLASSRQTPPPFGLVITWDLTRFNRILLPNVEPCASLVASGVQVQTLQPPTRFAHLADLGFRGNLDLSSSMHRDSLPATVKSSLRYLLSVKIKRGLLGRAIRGIWPAAAPIGYLSVEVSPGKRTIVPDPTRAPLIAQCFELFADGTHSLEDLEKWAHSEGLTSRRGNRLNRVALVKVLRDRVYIGLAQWAGEVYQGTHTSLVSSETWNKVQSTLDSVRRKRSGISASDSRTSSSIPEGGNHG